MNFRSYAMLEMVFAKTWYLSEIKQHLLLNRKDETACPIKLQEVLTGNQSNKRNCRQLSNQIREIDTE